MVKVIPNRVKKTWDAWNIRGVLLFSLSLQALLILVSPYRKATKKSFIMFLVWSGYLLADWAANFAVGLISDSQSDQLPRNSTSPENSDLLAFWAPFLLLHLGGPDTITALALEDNELWLRHMLGLISQAAAALYVFAQSLPNGLWMPTMLMFIAGVIKYGERTRALFLASLDRFRDSLLSEPDPGPNYAKLMEEYASKREAKLPTQIIYIPEPDKDTKIPDKTITLDDVKVVQKAYNYFKTFKGLVVDLIFSFKERNESRDFFRQLKPEDALRVVEVELNFIYEVLYTKVQVIQSAIGYIFRAVALGAILSSLGVFHYRVKKKGVYHGLDVRITYTLLWGAIALDFVALFMLIFSDWTLATVELLDVDDDSVSNRKKNSRRMKFKRWVVSIFSVFLSCKNPCWRPSKCMENHKVQHHVLATPILFRRWSGSVSGHNLIRYCLKGGPKTVHDFTGWTRVCIGKIAQYTGIALLLKWFRETVYPTTIKPIIIKGFLKPMAKKIRGFWKGVFTPVGEFVDSIGLTIRRWTAKRPWSSWVADKISKSVRYIWNLPWNLIDLLGLQDILDSLRYVSIDRFTFELWRFIFTELKQKSDYADDPETAKRISASRGDWILTDSDSDNTERRKLMRYVTDVKYDESLLLWHIATELLYNDDREKFASATPTNQQTNHNSGAGCLPKNEKGDDEWKERDFDEYDYREFSKMLSDYMIYLLIMQPTMMSAVAGIGKIRFRDTCAEARRFFTRRRLGAKDQEKACDQILGVNTDVEPVHVKGDRSKSVLFDACILAKKLKELEKEEKERMEKERKERKERKEEKEEKEKEKDEEKEARKNKWKLLSRMWVELMSYAAAHCRANTHAQQLSKGGELITFVWLLMAHFGLGEQFQINEGHARAKLVVGK
ncbi:hypothetical protein SLE2022_224090 [Rubroshorea leprosula]